VTVEAAADAAFRAAGGRILAALAARFRDVDLAEDALADALASAVPAWRAQGVPRDAAAWLYAAALRKAYDRLRRARTRDVAVHDAPEPEPSPEEVVIGAFQPLPDERLRLIFVCCHPAVAANARAALTLRVVCGLSVERLARAFLTSETTLQQRLVRAKAKIRDAGVSFEVPGPAAWPERLDAVLETLEIAYAQAYEDAALTGDAADFAVEVLRLSGLLADLLPGEPEVLGMAALVRLAEARRPARVDGEGAMVPLSDQDPRLWDARALAAGMALLGRAAALGRTGPRQQLAAIHAAYVRRWTGAKTPWTEILALYDALLLSRPTPVTAVNRAVVVARVHGASAGLAALAEAGAGTDLSRWAPWHAARADLLARAGHDAEAAAACEAALALTPPGAEYRHLRRRLAALRGEAA
jgi:RNA polymerase sigma-70 factor (ECF subfamily)